MDDPGLPQPGEGAVWITKVITAKWGGGVLVMPQVSLLPPLGVL